MWLNLQFLENPLSAYLQFLLILGVGLLFKRYVWDRLSRLLFTVIEKYSSGVSVIQFRDLLFRPVNFLITLITFYIAFRQLHYPPSWRMPTEEEFGIRFFIWRIFLLCIVISITWIATRLADFFGVVLLVRARRTESKSDDQLVPFLKEAIKVIIIIFSVFFALGWVFKLNIASIIAGLGIGGIAIALAAKDTLENLLGSFTIFLDKPFGIGDTVKVGGVTGTVERIGFRSTKIRTLEKTLVFVPNKKMTDSELENVTERKSIRGVFVITVDHDTPSQLVSALIAKIRELLSGISEVEHSVSVRLDRITDIGIDIQVIFLTATMDNDVYTGVRENVLLQTLQAMQELGIKAGKKL